MRENGERHVELCLHPERGGGGGRSVSSGVRVRARVGLCLESLLAARWQTAAVALTLGRETGGPSDPPDSSRLWE